MQTRKALTSFKEASVEIVKNRKLFIGHGRLMRIQQILK